MKRIILLLSLLLPVYAWASPSVSTVIGVSTLTISGSGFGVKSPAAPIQWNNHEACTVGSDIVASCNYSDESGDGSKAYIRNDRAYGISGTKSARMDYTTGENSMFPKIGTNIAGGATELYVSVQTYWTRYAGTGGASFIFKWSRGGSNPPYSGTPRFYETIRPNDGGSVDGGDAGYVTDAGTTYKTHTYLTGQNSNRWNRVEYHYKLSDPAGTANGAFEQWVNSVRNIDLVNAITRTTNESSSVIDYVMTPFDGNDSYGISNGYYLWVDDWYVDNTLARVEMCDSSTWAARTHCEIQPATAWAATSITATFNQGSFTTGATVYYYVIDSAGNASAAAGPYTLGSGGATLPVTTPSIIGGNHTTSKSVTLTTTGTSATYCKSISTNCTPETNYTEAVKVLQNIPYQKLCYQSTDGTNTEAVKCSEYRKRARK